jgi:hypothetical protein
MVTLEGRLSPRRWAPAGCGPPVRVRALVLDPHLGWGAPVEEARLARAENLAWLACLQRQLRAGPSTWSHQWAYGFCPVGAGLADRLAHLTEEYEAMQVKADEEGEARMLHRVCRKAWLDLPDAVLWEAPAVVGADLEEWSQYARLLHRLTSEPVMDEAPWERLGGGRRFACRPRLLELPSRMRALILDPPQDSPLPQTHFQELS